MDSSVQCVSESKRSQHQLANFHCDFLSPPKGPAVLHHIPIRSRIQFTSAVSATVAIKLFRRGALAVFFASGRSKCCGTSWFFNLWRFYAGNRRPAVPRVSSTHLAHGVQLPRVSAKLVRPWPSRDFLPCRPRSRYKTQHSGGIKICLALKPFPSRTPPLSVASLIADFITITAAVTWN